MENPGCFKKKYGNGVMTTTGGDFTPSLDGKYFRVDVQVNKDFIVHGCSNLVSFAAQVSHNESQYVVSAVLQL